MGWNKRLFSTLFALATITSILAATIGDGSSSILTGRAIDFTQQRQGCEVDGQSYASETSIPREHPCHYCLCFQGKVDCFWKNCPPPPDQCSVLSYENVCEPSLYHCPIPTGLKRVLASSPVAGKSSSAASATKQQGTYFQQQVTPSYAASQQQTQRYPAPNNHNNNKQGRRQQKSHRSGSKHGQIRQLHNGPGNGNALVSRQSPNDAYTVRREQTLGPSPPVSVPPPPPFAQIAAAPGRIPTRPGSGFKAPRKMEYFGTPFVASPHIPAGQVAPEGDFFKPMQSHEIPVSRTGGARNLRFRRVPLPGNFARQPTGSATYFRPRRSVDSVESSKMALPGVVEPFPVDLTSPEFYESLLSPDSLLPARVKRSINATIGSGSGNGNFIGDRGCDILGIRYEVGEIIGVASDLCMECRCAAQSLFCSPKCCFEPAKPRLEARFLDQSSLTGPSKYANRPTSSHPLQFLVDQYNNGEISS